MCVIEWHYIINLSDRSEISRDSQFVPTEIPTKHENQSTKLNNLSIGPHYDKIIFDVFIDGPSAVLHKLFFSWQKNGIAWYLL